MSMVMVSLVQRCSLPTLAKSPPHLHAGRRLHAVHAWPEGISLVPKHLFLILSANMNFLRSY